MPNVMTKERLKYGKVLCGVCHRPIEASQEWDFYPISRVSEFNLQVIVAHTKCVIKEVK